MSKQHLSRGILVLVLAFAATSCMSVKSVAPAPAPTATPTATPAPAPQPNVQPAVTSPRAADALPFASDGERLAYETEQYLREVRCTKGNGSKGAPMICVDNVTTRPDPYWVQVWDVEGNGGQRTESPVYVHWFTRRAAELRIEFQPGPDGRSCVTELICKGDHCSAKVEPLGDLHERSCRYNVWIDGRQVESKSPLMSVVPCCW